LETGNWKLESWSNEQGNSWLANSPLSFALIAICLNVCYNIFQLQFPTLHIFQPPQQRSMIFNLLEST